MGDHFNDKVSTKSTSFKMYYMLDAAWLLEQGNSGFPCDYYKVIIPVRVGGFIVKQIRLDYIMTHMWNTMYQYVMFMNHCLVREGGHCTTKGFRPSDLQSEPLLFTGLLSLN